MGDDDEPAISMDTDPLVWWSKRESHYPLTSALARHYLCIPGTSVPSERVFSTAGDVLTAQRAQLKWQHVDKLIFLKKNTHVFM